MPRPPISIRLFAVTVSIAPFLKLNANIHFPSRAPDERSLMRRKSSGSQDVQQVFRSVGVRQPNFVDACRVARLVRRSRFTRLWSALNSPSLNVCPALTEQFQSGRFQFAIESFARVCAQDRNLLLPDNVSGVDALIDVVQRHPGRSLIDNAPHIRISSAIVGEICGMEVDTTLR